MPQRRLVVYVPAIGMTCAQWAPLIERLRDQPDLAGTEWVGWDHGIGLYSVNRVTDVAIELQAVIDAHWRLADGYDEIVLVGHSFGGMLVRQCYLLASGCQAGHPGSTWATRVRRIVLLAAINRGLDQRKPMIRLYDWVTRCARALTFRHFIGQELISGSAIVTNMRLAWIRHMRALPEDRRPDMVQMLGTVDSVVSRRDSVDLEQFPNAMHISVPGLNHRQLPLLHSGPDPDLRVRLIHDAILGRALPNADARLLSTPHRDIVFVLHGIRAANRGWVEQLEARVRQHMPEARVITPSYGFLSALEFAIPSLHKRPVRTFQQLYSDCVAENPDARFHFVGHSNGTYILGESLRALPAMRFERVALAGSVLPRDFGWRELMRGDSPQVGMLRNDCANLDVPVGILCSGLTGLRRRDIGTGGFEGFLHDDDRVVQYWYHDGAHDAALSEANLDSIARYLAGGDTKDPPPGLAEGKKYFERLSRLAPILVPVALVCLVAGIVYAVATGAWLVAAATVVAVVALLKVW